MNTSNGDGQPGSTESYRIGLGSADHRWSFVLTAADAGLMQKRISELASDPDAPLSPSDARLVGERIRQIRAAAVSSPVIPDVDPPASSAGPSGVTVRR